MPDYWRVYCNGDKENEVDFCTFKEMLIKYGDPTKSFSSVCPNGWVTPNRLYNSILYTKAQLEKGCVPLPLHVDEFSKGVINELLSFDLFPLWTHTLYHNMKNGYYAIPEYLMKEEEMDFIVENSSRVYLNCRLFAS